MKVSFYNAAGMFMQTLEGDEKLVITPTANSIGLPYVEGEYGTDHWFTAGSVQPRPPCPATLDASGVLHDVPANSIIVINGMSYPCAAGGTVELEFDQPGTYHIQVRSWPALEGEFTHEID